MKNKGGGGADNGEGEGGRRGGRGLGNGLIGAQLLCFFALRKERAQRKPHPRAAARETQ